MAHIRTDSLCRPRPRRLGILARISRMIAVRRQRHHLARLSDHQLRDIGVTRHEAQVEANRPSWDVPDTWRM